MGAHGAPISTDEWLAAAAVRRSVYGLKNTSAISEARIEEIVQKVMSFAPSSYNTQPVRISLVLGAKHKEMWDLIFEQAEPILKSFGEQVWGMMGPRLEAFRGAYGSVVFWESQNTIEEAKATHKSSAEMFAQWGEHANGIHQILVWTALELEGLGANLQHLNSMPPVEAAMKKFLAVPDDWRLRAHLNFGDEAQPHPEKPAKLPYSQTITVVKP